MNFCGAQVLNRVARSVIEQLRHSASEYVFTFKGKPVARLYNSAWKRAREKAADGYEQRSGKPCPEGFRRIRVHDHTFGRRLRAAGVSFEDRQDLLGHTSGRITTHYSGAELGNLIEAAERVCGENSRKTPALVMLRQA
jgi:integrase